MPTCHICRIGIDWLHVCWHGRVAVIKERKNESIIRFYSSLSHIVKKGEKGSRNEKRATVNDPSVLHTPDICYRFNQAGYRPCGGWFAFPSLGKILSTVQGEVACRSRAWVIYECLYCSSFYFFFLTLIVTPSSLLLEWSAVDYRIERIYSTFPPNELRCGAVRFYIFLAISHPDYPGWGLWHPGKLEVKTPQSRRRSECVHAELSGWSTGWFKKTVEPPTHSLSK